MAADEHLSLDVDTTMLEEMMRSLPDAVARKAMRKALRAAGQEILNPMITLAPERTGTPTPKGDSLPPGVLKADLGTRIRLEEDGGSVFIGPSRDTAHVARWINDGWTLTGHKPGKKTIRDIPGKHFIEGAADEGAQRAVNAFTDTLMEEIQQATDQQGVSND